MLVFNTTKYRTKWAMQSEHAGIWDTAAEIPFDKPEHMLSTRELNAVRKEMAEIAIRAAQIKAGWTKKERAARRVGTNGRIPWSLPEYCTVYVPASMDGRANRKEKRTKIYRPLPTR